MAKTATKGVPLDQQQQRAAPEAPGSELRLYANFASTYVHTARHGVTIDDVLRPGYWRNHWRILPRNTEIAVLAADGTWEARLRVVASGEAFARSRVLWMWTAEPVDLSLLPTGWTLEYVDSGWRVKNATSQVVTHSHPTQELALDASVGMVAKLRG